MNIPKTVLIIGAVLFTVSCGFAPAVPKRIYKGDMLPIENVAVISEGYRGWVQVTHIDDEPVASVTGPQSKGLHVRPGTHNISVRLQQIYGGGGGVAPTLNRSSFEVVLVVEAGHSYMLELAETERGLGVHFQDKGVGYNQECMLPQSYWKIYIDGIGVPGC